MGEGAEAGVRGNRGGGEVGEPWGVCDSEGSDSQLEAVNVEDLGDSGGESAEITSGVAGATGETISGMLGACRGRDLRRRVVSSCRTSSTDLLHCPVDTGHASACKRGYRRQRRRCMTKGLCIAQSSVRVPHLAVHCNRGQRARRVTNIAKLHSSCVRWKVGGINTDNSAWSLL